MTCAEMPPRPGFPSFCPSIAPSFRTRVPANASSSRRAIAAASRCTSTMRVSSIVTARIETDFGAEQVKSKNIRRSFKCTWVSFPPFNPPDAGYRRAAKTPPRVTVSPLLQSQSFRTLTDPVTGLRFLLRVVVVMRKMLVKILRRRRPILLWFSREHDAILVPVPTRICGKSAPCCAPQIAVVLARARTTNPSKSSHDTNPARPQRRTGRTLSGRQRWRKTGRAPETLLEQPRLKTQTETGRAPDRLRESQRSETR